MFDNAQEMIPVTKIKLTTASEKNREVAKENLSRKSIKNHSKKAEMSL